MDAYFYYIQQNNVMKLDEYESYDIVYVFIINGQK